MLQSLQIKAQQETELLFFRNHPALPVEILEFFRRDVLLEINGQRARDTSSFFDHILGVRFCYIISEEFSPFDVHYAKIFIIPTSVGQYILTPSGVSKGKTVMVIDAFVR